MYLLSEQLLQPKINTFNHHDHCSLANQLYFLMFGEWSDREMKNTSGHYGQLSCRFMSGVSFCIPAVYLFFGVYQAGSL